MLESHQYKHKKNPTKPNKFEGEYDKAVSSNNDFFILFTTNTASMNTANPKFARSAIVCRDNFREYFGPFAGRAFCVKKDINTATAEEYAMFPVLAKQRFFFFLLIYLYAH